jgi:taurine dioxygenase
MTTAVKFGSVEYCLDPYPFYEEPSHVEGMDASESDRVFQRCFDVLYRPEHMHVHDWELHDLAVWDNLALQHARGVPQPNTRRTMRRVVVSTKSYDALMAAANGADGEVAAGEVTASAIRQSTVQF